MKRLLIVLFIFFTSLVVSATETVGFLSLKDKLDSLKVGDINDYELVLAPFDIREISASSIPKQFLDVFYIVSIDSIAVSQANADAVIVKLQMALTTELRQDQPYLLQLGERNIPVQMRLPEVSGTELVKEQFSFFQSPFEFPGSVNWFWFGIAIGMVLSGLLIFYFLERKKKAKFLKQDQKKELVKLFKETVTHQDLERLFRMRREVAHFATSEPLKKQIDSFFSGFEIDQYRPNWKERDLAPLVKEANSIAEQLKAQSSENRKSNGV